MTPAETATLEQARLTGVGSEREAALMTKLEAAEKERGIDEQRIADLMDELNRVGHENDALRAALEKIADWYGSWGPYPETNKSWCAMAIVTAREAVKPLYLAPSAQPAPSICPAALSPVINWLRNGCDPMEAANELEILTATTETKENDNVAPD